MKTIRLDVNDNIFDKVMLFLSNLPKKDIQLIIEEKNYRVKKFKSFSIKTKKFKFDREDANAR